MRFDIWVCFLSVLGGPWGWLGDLEVDRQVSVVSPVAQPQHVEVPNHHMFHHPNTRTDHHHEGRRKLCWNQPRVEHQPNAPGAGGLDLHTTNCKRKNIYSGKGWEYPNHQVGIGKIMQTFWLELAMNSKDSHITWSLIWKNKRRITPRRYRS